MQIKQVLILQFFSSLLRFRPSLVLISSPVPCFQIYLVCAALNVRRNLFGTTKYIPIQCNVQNMKLIMYTFLSSILLFPSSYLSVRPSVRLSIYLWVYSPCGSWPPFQFLNLYTFGRTPWTGDQPVAKPLLAQRTTQTQIKSRGTSMPRVGFEPMIPVFERVKMVHGLDCAATVIGISSLLGHNIPLNNLHSNTYNLHSSHIYLLCLEFEPVVPYSSRILSCTAT
jgi:hypothetical protein